jgi:putative ABC transport system permease protein
MTHSYIKARAGLAPAGAAAAGCAGGGKVTLTDRPPSGIGPAVMVAACAVAMARTIGLRRALGATRRHVAEQFLAEAVLLSVLGGVAGTVTGALATAIYAVSQGWSVQIPAVAFYGGLGAALLIGALAGLYPSMRAARLSPTEALRTV